MKETTLEFLYKLWGVAGVAIVTALLAIGLLSVKACVVNDRDRQAACSQAGGKLLFTDCVQIEYVPTENWRK